MNLIVCLDNANGMAFNNRRQSMDRVVREKILSLCRGSLLWMDSYSSSQFEDCRGISVDEECIRKAGESDYCFVERQKVFADEIQKLMVFRWNRDYPSDLRLGFDIAGSGFELKEISEFPGYSHEKITLEVYEK